MTVTELHEWLTKLIARGDGSREVDVFGDNTFFSIHITEEIDDSLFLILNREATHPLYR